jgi:hypothetical protein
MRKGVKEKQYVPCFIGPALFLDGEIKYELFFPGYSSELFPKRLIPDDVFLSLIKKKKMFVKKVGINNLLSKEKDLIILLKENNLLY